MIKTLVIWLVRLLKLEEVFITEAKEAISRKLLLKVKDIESLLSNVSSSNETVKEVEMAIEKLPKYALSFLGDSHTKLLTTAKEKMYSLESGLGNLKKDIEEIAK